MPEIPAENYRSDNEPQELDIVNQVDVFEPDVESQQVELVYTQAGAAIRAAFILACLVAFGLWEVADKNHLMLWIAAQAVQTFVRMGIVIKFRKSTHEERQSPKWMLLFVVSTMVAGIVWGCLGLMFSYAWPLEYQTLTLLSIAGIVSGAISSYAAIMSVYIAFMVPCLLIPAQAMLVYSSDTKINLGLIIMLFAGVLSAIARNYNKNVVGSLQLRNENIALVRNLRDANMKLQDVVGVGENIQKSLVTEQRLFTNGPVTVYRYAAEDDWPLDYISGTVEQFGYSAEELIAARASFREIIYPDDLGRVENALLRLGSSGDVGIDYRIKCGDGRVRWVYDYSVAIMNDEDEVSYYSGYIMDITDRKAAEYDLQQEKEKAELTLHSIAEAVITTDRNGQVEYLSPRAEELTGWECTMARGLPVSRVFSLFDDDSQEFIQSAVQKCHDVGKTVTSAQDIQLARNDGEQYMIRYSASPIKSHTESLLGVILVFHDVTDARHLERKLSYAATHDPLTGLLNRSEFERQIEDAIEFARRDKDEHVLLHVDIDQLKIINETGSHEAGDQLLKSFSLLLRECLRDSDTIARLGGDEFGALLKNCPLDNAISLVDNIIESVKQFRFTTEDRVFEISAGVGVTVISENCKRVTHAMSEADLACNVAKETGGSNYHVYRSNDEALMKRQDEMQWVSRISEAILADRLVLFYQVIEPISPNGDEGMHFEVLVRMQDEQGNLVMPNRFLPAAERYNLINGIDRWVITNTFCWYARNCRQGDNHPVTMISINLSGASICNPALQLHIITAMESYGIPPESVCFEITETAAISNLTAATDFMNKLKRLGCHFALDDFGSGLSSFAYLKNLPVDFLKIDGSFVRNMDTDDVSQAMVSAIQQLGKVMGIRTIAEFVENDSIMEMLAELGVDFAQGYAISHPQPLDELDVGERRSA